MAVTTSPPKLEAIAATDGPASFFCAGRYWGEAKRAGFASPAVMLGWIGVAGDELSDEPSEVEDSF